MRRTSLHKVMPWVGGINTSVDSGVLNEQDLVIADNVVFSSTGARIKREALEYLDLDIPVPNLRSSSGTTRSLYWTTNILNVVSPNDEKLVVGEYITVTGNADYNVSHVQVTSVNINMSGETTITYEAPNSLTENQTTAGLVVERASAVIMVKDYWRFVPDGENTQMFVYATEDFQLFTLDDSGRRTQIHGQEQQFVVQTVAASALSAGDHWLLNAANNSTRYYVWYKIDGVGVDPAISGRTGVLVSLVTGDNANTVASKTQAAVDALADFTATVLTNQVTVTAGEAGVTDPAGDINTTFTFTILAYGATTPSSTLETIRTNVFNERLQIYFSGRGNYPIIYNPDDGDKYQLMGTYTSAGLSMPDASFAFNHLSRVWANDKDRPDYMHYCETFNEDNWLGIGDSGALPIAPGDGDPTGIANAYSYKEFVIVAKADARYRIMGDSPENFDVQAISSGMGNQGALSIPVDEKDVIFISRRGVHSQAVTDQYGDVDAAYVSAKIKPSFNAFDQSSIKLIQGTYIPELNSIALAIQDEQDDRQNHVWLYNFEVQSPNAQNPGEWYRWPDISCTALSRRLVQGTHKIVTGTVDGRIIQAQKAGDFTDFGTTGIPYTIKSGTIYPGNDPQSMKAFKRISLIYRPKGNFSFSVLAKIDNQEQQGFAFNEISGLDLLGETFILGTSLLGSSNTLAPYTFTMDGYGRGVVLTITQPSADEQIEIWGFVIEYENVDLQQEVT